jgi:hypothetical protein
LLNGVLIAYSFQLLYLRSQEKQIGDAEVYFNESLMIDKWIFHEFFLSIHNYGYPSFLSILRSIKIDSRFEIGVTQHLLLLLSVILLSFVISKKKYFIQTFTLLNVSIFLPNGVAYSGNTLTESLVSTIYVICLATLILILIGLKNNNHSYKKTLQITNYVFLLALLAGLIMMIRPAHIMLPIVFYVVVLAIFLLYKRTFWSLILVSLVFFSGVIIAFIPEFMISNLLGGSIKNSIFSLGMAFGNNQYANYNWAYFTNMTSCGPVAWSLSPHWDWPATYNISGGLPDLTFFDKSVARVMHLVNMIDPRPGPTYVFSLNGTSWYFLTILNTLIILTTLFINFLWLKNYKKNHIQDIKIYIIFNFLILSSLLLAMRIHGEYRFGQLFFINMATFCAYFFNNSDYRVKIKENKIKFMFVLIFTLLLLYILKEISFGTSDVFNECRLGLAR